VKTKENISLTINRGILTKSKEIAREESLDFSNYVEQLLVADILKVRKKVI
jgi:hypothetical protein